MTGTITQSANVDNTAPRFATPLSRIVATGGDWDRATNNLMAIGETYAVNSTTFNATSAIGYNGTQVYLHTLSSLARTNAPYWAWIIYRK
jgi:hypothetical protein